MRTTRRAIVVLCLILPSLLGAFSAWAVWSRGQRGPLAELADAIGSDHDFDARLTGGFLPRAETAARRSATTPAGDRLSPDARIAIARLEKQAAADQSPRALAALGAAYLVEGDVDRSVTTLEDAATGGDQAQAWNDLSAAYLAKTERMPARRIEYYSRALEAATKSLRASPSNEARFNRALALDGLAPFVGSIGAWSDYLSTERDPRWIDAAKRHASADKPAPDARERWEARRGDLRSRLRAGDRVFVDATVKEFPEASIEFFEHELLVAFANGDGTALAEAETLAGVIEAVTHDPMPRDDVRLIKARGHALAQPHLDYIAGLKQYDADDYATAKDSFSRALAGFVRVNSPYRAWASAQLATILFQQRNLDAADRQLADVERIARAARYATLLGRTLRLRGLVYSKQWRLAEALEAFRASASTFESANEHEDAVSLYGHLADVLRTLGEHSESWEYIGRTLEGLPRVRKAARRYLSLYNASLFASSQDLLVAAQLFQDGAVREATAAGAVALVEALTHRGIIHTRLQNDAAATIDLEMATRHFADIPEGALKQYMRAEIAVLQAHLASARSGRETDQALISAIDFFGTAEPARVPQLYLLLARARQATHADSAAEDALSRGIARLERQQSRVGDEGLKISYFDESWDLFPEMIQFQLNVRSDPAKAFEYAERSRSRALLAATASTDVRPRNLVEIQNALPPSVVLLYYATLSDRLLIWTITSVDSRLVERRIDRESLGRLVARYRAALAEGRDTAASNAALYDVLVRPVERALGSDSTIVLVPDGDLQRLPFATLRNSTHRFLIEDHAVAYAPSGSVFVAGLSQLRRMADGPIASALLVGNPETSSSPPARLQPLSGAETEVSEAAKTYPKHSVLTGASATKDRFVASAPEFDVVHFGGHAFVNAEYPLLSRLAFSQPLFAHEISRIPFSRTRLVILAACSTASGAISKGEGVVSVARPFLAAGVPMVVASQWDVDDGATAQLFVAFHRALAETQDPVRALRRAQISLLRSGNTVLASPANWGAFVALGTTVQ
jgi:CHAT domain-containing protein